MLSIPKYRIIQKLGEGRDSISYLAEHRVLGRQLVLKVSSASDLTNEDAESGYLYLKKARAYASLKHPSIVHVHDIGLTNKSLFFVVTDYYNQGNLQDRLSDQGLGLDQAIKIITDIASALDHAHGKGVSHCDLTPSNIVFSEDETVLLTGFSVVKTKKWNTNCDASKDNELFERQEQIKFDVYRLAVIFYEMITGAKILYEGVFDAPPTVQNKYAYLQETIDKALSSHPEERFVTAGSLVQSIQNAVASVSPQKEIADDSQNIVISGIDDGLVNTPEEGMLFIEPSSYILGESNHTTRIATWGLAVLGGVVLVSGLYFNGAFEQQDSIYAENEPVLEELELEVEQAAIPEDHYRIEHQNITRLNRALVTPKNLEQELEELYASLSTYTRLAASENSLVKNVMSDDNEQLIVLDRSLHRDKLLVAENKIDEVVSVENETFLTGSIRVAAIDMQTQKPLQARFFIIPEKGPMRTSRAGEQVNFKLATGHYTLLAEYNNQQSELYGVVITANREISKTLVINSQINTQNEVVASRDATDSYVDTTDETGLIGQESIVESEESDTSHSHPESATNLDNKYL